MELVRGLDNLREEHRGCVLTIGGFDGLHLGHQALLARTLERARAASRRSMMLVFEPMPREFLKPENPPARLANFRERWRLVEPRGIDVLLVLRFCTALRNLSGRDFLGLLAEPLRAAALVVGHDCRFGRDGECDAPAIAAAGQALGFDVEIVEPVLVDGVRASSSAIRAQLAAGQLGPAARMLGRRYSMCGRVLRGERLGRTLGFPTANLRLGRLRAPLQGIFAVNVRGAAADVRAGVASLGTRPTVGGVEPLLEAHLFDFSGDLYGREIEVEFVAKIRDEARFADLDAMVAQMHRDATAARAILAA
jgi:riboflavin kinase/FMN adenylyltransferase